MGLKLMYITNEPNIAKLAENSGVDWIFIDLEINGKEERQGHLDTVISKHNIEDVKKIKPILKRSKLIVRVNPIYKNSKYEIEKVINYGADIVMLPFFKTRDEVKEFIDIIDNRALVCLLCETKEAVKNIDEIISLKGIDFMHIGLNDLHLAYKKKFMFELLSDGTVEMLCNKFKEKGIIYGFGGIAQLGKGDLPAEYILAEHYRLGSSMTILSRSFCNIKKNNIEDVENIFYSGVSKIRLYEKYLEDKNFKFFERNKKDIDSIVLKIKNNTMVREGI